MTRIRQQPLRIRQTYHLLMDAPWREGNAISSKGIAFVPNESATWKAEPEAIMKLEKAIAECDKLILSCAWWLKIGPTEWENFDEDQD